MKVRHLKSFPQHTNYEEYKGGGNINKPHVAYCIKENEVHYDPYIDPYNGHEYVDLGLPSRTMWSTKNVGAETVADKGLYFAWGETVGFKTIDERNNYTGLNNAFSWDDYKFGTSENITKYNNSDGLTRLEKEDDAVSVYMGGLWHSPTKEQFQELLDNCDLNWNYKIEGNNATYLCFTSKLNGNQILFNRTTGSMYNNMQFGNNSNLTFKTWSCDLATRNKPNTAYCLSTGSNRETISVQPITTGTSYIGDRYYGFTIRGVVG